MNKSHKYDHLGESMNSHLLQFYDAPVDEVDSTISDDLASIDKRYSSFELLAEGGTKRVYKALDNVVQREIAYARLQAGKESQRENFLREARLTSLLHHPGIISILDMGLEEEDPFFTMELKVGHSLGFILKKIANGEVEYCQKYSLKKLLDIFSKICEAVSYAHSQEIIHLDLKPDNIQVGEFGEVVICDWGLGKLISDQDETRSDNYESLLKTQTMTGSIKGTPGFMAPEQIKKGVKKDQQTDVFALGAILYNILTYKIPFDGDVQDILKQTVVGDFQAPISINNKISESLNAVCLKALATEKKSRYQTVADLRAEIENYLSGFATKAENASFVKLLLLFYQRHRALMVTLIGAISVYFISSLLFINKINNEKNEAIKQKQLAVEAQAAAEKSFENEKVARQEAEEALEMYEEQRSVTEDYRKKIIDRSLSFLRRNLYHPDINKKNFIIIARELRLLAEREPDDPDVCYVKGYLAFTMHRFKDAEKDLAKSGKLGLLVKILKDFHQHVEPKNEYTTDEVIQLIKLIYQRRGEKGFSDIVHLLRYEALLLKDNFHEPVEVVLRIFNGPNFNFNYVKEDSYLEIGRPNSTLKLQYDMYNFLRVLRIRNLKLKGIVEAPRVLSQIRVLILDISEAHMDDYKFLKSAFSIKKLTVRKGQINKELLEYLRQYIELEEV